MPKDKDYGVPIACRIPTKDFNKFMEIVLGRRILKAEAMRTAILEYIDRADRVLEKYESEL